jgi:hypothetical protein
MSQYAIEKKAPCRWCGVKVPKGRRAFSVNIRTFAEQASLNVSHNTDDLSPVVLLACPELLTIILVKIKLHLPI